MLIIVGLYSFIGDLSFSHLTVNKLIGIPSIFLYYIRVSCCYCFGLTGFENPWALPVFTMSDNENLEQDQGHERMEELKSRNCIYSIWNLLQHPARSSLRLFHQRGTAAIDSHLTGANKSGLAFSG